MTRQNLQSQWPRIKVHSLNILINGPNIKYPELIINNDNAIVDLRIQILQYIMSFVL